MSSRRHVCSFIPVFKVSLCRTAPTMNVLVINVLVIDNKGSNGATGFHVRLGLLTIS